MPWVPIHAASSHEWAFGWLYLTLSTKSVGGPHLTDNKFWVPHLRDGLIVAKVGICTKARAYLPLAADRRSNSNILHLP